MGAGNPKLSSFDSEKFEPTTYFLDLGEDFEQVEPNLIDESDEEPSDDQVWSEVAMIEEMNFEDLVQSLCSELGHSEHSLKESYSELSYAFRESGLILTEGTLCYVITETGSEYSHLPIGVIPNFRFNDFICDAESEIWDKQDWYRARGKDWDAAVQKLADRAWEKKMKEFHNEAANILEKLYGWYGDKMSCRAGAWCRGAIDLPLAV